MALGLVAWARRSPRAARRVAAAAAIAVVALTAGLRRERAAPPAMAAPPATAAAAEAAAAAGTARAPGAARAGEAPARPALDPATAATGALAAARARAEACEQRLAAAEAAHEAALAELAPPAERWAAAPPDPARTARLRAPLLAALAALPELAVPQIECRGALCQLELLAPTRAAAHAGLRALAADPDLRALAIGFAAEPGAPLADAGSGRGAYAVTAYVITRDAAPAAAGADPEAPLRAAIADARASGALERCAAAGPDRGTLEVELAATADSPHATLALGGSLAGTAVGRCLGAALERAVSARRLPPATAGSVAASLVSPHGP
jgi:hypothetical protein